MAGKKRAVKKAIASKRQLKRDSSSAPIKIQRSYPARTLEEALAIPQAIRDKNNGNPWATDDVAQASLGVSKNSNKFFYAAASARDYGLTVGSRDTEKIELGSIGREIVFAADPATKRQKMIDAFFSIDIFKRVYEHHGSANLPEAEFRSYVLLGDFELPKDFHEEFVTIFKANASFWESRMG